MIPRFIQIFVYNLRVCKSKKGFTYGNRDVNLALNAYVYHKGCHINAILYTLIPVMRDMVINGSILQLAVAAVGDCKWRGLNILWKLPIKISFKSSTEKRFLYEVFYFRWIVNAYIIAIVVSLNIFSIFFCHIAHIRINNFLGFLLFAFHLGLTHP